MNILIMAFQCGIFVAIPLITFIVGILKILPNIKEKYQTISISALLGFIFFETSMVGLLIDPRVVNKSFQEILIISLAIGMFGILLVLIFNLIYIASTKASKK